MFLPLLPAISTRRHCSLSRLHRSENRSLYMSGGQKTQECHCDAKVLRDRQWRGRYQAGDRRTNIPALHAVCPELEIPDPEWERRACADNGLSPSASSSEIMNLQFWVYGASIVDLSTSSHGAAQSAFSEDEAASFVFTGLTSDSGPKRLVIRT